MEKKRSNCHHLQMTWHYIRFPGGSAGKKNSPTMWETWVWSLGWENPLEKGTATHSSIPPGEFHGLYSPWGLKDADMTDRLSLSYTENPKDATRKLLEHISECGKVAGYKINTEKSIAFPYIHNGRPEREITETISLTITSQRWKYLERDLSKEAKDLYSENGKTPMKETEGDKKGWKDIPCSWTGRINVVKMTPSPRQFTDSLWSIVWRFLRN